MIILFLSLSLALTGLPGAKGGLHCMRRDTDVVFLVDGSNSVAHADFEAGSMGPIKEFLRGAAREILKANANSTVSIVQFSFNSTVEVRHGSLSVALAGIDAMKQMRKGSFPGDALARVEAELVPASSPRSKQVFYMSDGRAKTQTDAELALEVARRLRARGVEMFALALKNKYAAHKKANSAKEQGKFLAELQNLVGSNKSVHVLKSYSEMESTRKIFSRLVCQPAASGLVLECFNQPSDVVILVDGSASIDETSFKQSMKNFILSGAQQLLNGNPASTISIVQFSSDYKVEQAPTSDFAQVKRSIDRMTQLYDGTIMIPPLEHIRNEIFKNGSRHGHEIFIISDGLTDDSTGRLIRLADAMRAEGTNIFAIGCGEEGADDRHVERKKIQLQNFLQILAGGESNVRMLDNVDSLEENKELFQRLICTRKTTTSTTSTSTTTSTTSTTSTTTTPTTTSTTTTPTTTTSTTTSTTSTTTTPTPTSTTSTTTTPAATSTTTTTTPSTYSTTTAPSTAAEALGPGPAQHYKSMDRVPTTTVPTTTSTTSTTKTPATTSTTTSTTPTKILPAEPPVEVAILPQLVVTSTTTAPSTTAKALGPGPGQHFKSMDRVPTTTTTSTTSTATTPATTSATTSMTPKKRLLEPPVAVAVLPQLVVTSTTTAPSTAAKTLAPGPALPPQHLPPPLRQPLPEQRPPPTPQRTLAPGPAQHYKSMDMDRAPKCSSQDGPYFSKSCTEAAARALVGGECVAVLPQLVCQLDARKACIDAGGELLQAPSLLYAKPVLGLLGDSGSAWLAVKYQPTQPLTGNYVLWNQLSHKAYCESAKSCIELIQAAPNLPQANAGVVISGSRGGMMTAAIDSFHRPVCVFQSRNFNFHC